MQRMTSSETTRATDIANRVDFVARVRDVVDFGEQRELLDRLRVCGAMDRALTTATSGDCLVGRGGGVV